MIRRVIHFLFGLPPVPSRRTQALAAAVLTELGIARNDLSEEIAESVANALDPLGASERKWLDDQHDRRVTELLAANSVDVERRRQAERKLNEVAASILPLVDERIAALVRHIIDRPVPAID